MNLKSLCSDGVSLFYPDFVVRMKSGDVYVFDTKTKGSDTDAPEKHNAFLAYAAEQTAKGNKLQGVSIINDSPGTA